MEIFWLLPLTSSVKYLSLHSMIRYGPSYGRWSGCLWESCLTYTYPVEDKFEETYDCCVPWYWGAVGSTVRIVAWGFFTTEVSGSCFIKRFAARKSICGPQTIWPANFGFASASCQHANWARKWGNICGHQTEPAKGTRKLYLGHTR